VERISWSQLEALGMSFEFISGSSLPSASGMNFRSSVHRWPSAPNVSRKIGGFAAMAADFLADDLCSVRELASAGWRVNLTSVRPSSRPSAHCFAWAR
jgi:hypothetical protein